MNQIRWNTRRLRSQFRSHSATAVLQFLASTVLPLALFAQAAQTTNGRSQTRDLSPVSFAFPPVRPVALVLEGVTIIDVEHGERWRNQRVVIEGNRISALGSASKIHVPLGAQVVDAHGKYVIPGLWDMHIHPAGLAPPGGEHHQVNAVYRQLLAAGITGIRDAGSAIPLDTFRVWKREIAAGRRVGPRLIVSGPSIQTEGDGPHFLLVTDPTDAPRVVDSLKAAGADMIKIREVSGPIWFALAAAARRAAIPFGGHFTRRDDLPDTVDALVVSDSGPIILDHWLDADACGGRADTGLSLPRCVAAAARLRGNHTWVATFYMGDPSLPWPRPELPDSFRRRALRYSVPVRELLAAPAGTPAWRPLTEAERRQLPTGADWAKAWAKVNGDSATTVWNCRVARLAYAADLPWMSGPDFPMGPLGWGVHLDLLNPVLCGVPPLWTLQGATLNPARALGLTDSLGTVTAGKVADLVLLDGDPLEDIWNVSKTWAVVADGRYYDRAALDRLLIEASEEWHAVGALTRKAEAP